MPEALVRHFMSAAVETVEPSLPVVEVAARMHDSQVSCVVVCEDGKPVGIVSERDLSRLCVAVLEGSAPATVADFMTTGLHTLTVDARCSEAVRLLREKRVRRVVVVGTDGSLEGVITQSDLLRAHSEEIELQKQLLEKRVAERTRELAQANALLEGLARIDPLLEVGNRRAMDDELEKLEQRARRYRRPYCVALVDVDFFKKFNDRYGHQDGDEVLRQVSRTMSRAIRAADTVFRYGGEEFLVTLPEVGLDGAAIAAEHIRTAIDELCWPHADSPYGRVTVSVGVAEESLVSVGWSHLVSRADEALYEAKRAGRNRVECAPSPGIAQLRAVTGSAPSS